MLTPLLHTQPFLRNLIKRAVHVWQIPPAAIYRASGREARQARIAVFAIAYAHGCQQSDLANAFGWSGAGRRNFSPHEVGRSHEKYRADADYHTRFTELTHHARTLTNVVTIQRIACAAA